MALHTSKVRRANANDLMKEWKRIVNDHVMVGRDSHLLKAALARLAPSKILLGFYRYKANPTITLPIFFSLEEEWLVEDEFEAELELAVEITGERSRAYLVYRDYEDWQTADERAYRQQAKGVLEKWVGDLYD